MRKLFFVFLIIFSFSFSQDYDKGLMCFLDKDYVCARNYFSDIVHNQHQFNSITIEYAHYYLFLSALHLYHYDTDYLFDSFISHFPFSNKREDAVFFMSEYLFEKKQHKSVVALLSQTNLYQFSDLKKNRAFFYLGYSAYKEENFDLAKSSFYELNTGFDNLYREDAIFYNSHILFLENSFELALSGFKELVNSTKYATKVPYFIAHILFNLDQYDTLVNYLKPLLKSNNFNNYKELVLLQAKSHYHLNQYDESIAYFEEYKELNKSLNREQLYQIGIAYYRKGLYGFSINHLNKIVITKNDSLAQYAFYYLGDSYRYIENRTEAMHAFRSASLLETDSLIQHDAFYQFVILCYEQNSPLYSPKEYLSKFIDKYPKSKHIDEIYSCLANIHLNTYDYDNAISVLEQSNLLSNSIKYQYQKICFHRGVQVYNDGLYNEAITYFNKSISVGDKNNLLYDAYYWKGESYYNVNMFDNALHAYSQIEGASDSLYRQILYSQAYCYLKKKDYVNAVKLFNKSIPINNSSIILYDIYLRMGDSYFALTNYDLSSKFYDQAMSVSGFEDDYAAYKKSTSYVLLGQYSDAIESFKYLINNFKSSNYLDDALFDLGNVYILSRNFDLAINTFNNIINNFKNSLFYASSQLKLGLVYYMQEKDAQAISILENLLSESRESATSKEALGIIKNIYNEMGEADKFLELIQNIEHDYTKAELDSSMYSSAELQYMKENYESSINAFKVYLSYYPNGFFLLEAKYFLHKSYEKIGDLESAIEVLSQIVDNAENKYTTEGLLSLGRMSYELKKYISAESYFSKLLNIASSIENKKEAILGILESKFNLYQYSDVVNDISSLVEEGLFSGREEIRIHYLKAYSLYKLNKIAESLVEFTWLTNHTEGELKAESYYYMSLLLYNDKQYDNSQKIIFQLINEMPTYQIWVHKALLLLAKNYIMQEDMFQAHHVLIELEKQCENEEILLDLRNILITHFPNEIDSINNKQ